MRSAIARQATLDRSGEAVSPPPLVPADASILNAITQLRSTTAPRGRRPAGPRAPHLSRPTVLWSGRRWSRRCFGEGSITPLCQARGFLAGPGSRRRSHRAVALTLLPAWRPAIPTVTMRAWARLEDTLRAAGSSAVSPSSERLAIIFPLHVSASAWGVGRRASRGCATTDLLRFVSGSHALCSPIITDGEPPGVVRGATFDGHREPA